MQGKTEYRSESYSRIRRARNGGLDTAVRFIETLLFVVELYVGRLTNLGSFALVYFKEFTILKP